MLKKMAILCVGLLMISACHTHKSMSGNICIKREYSNGVWLEKGNKVHFAPKSAALSKEAMKVLDSYAMKMKDTRSIYVIGYADKNGNCAANVKLSQHRADAVKSYLKKKGFKAKMVTVAEGDKFPIFWGNSKHALAENRAVIMRAM